MPNNHDQSPNMYNEVDRLIHEPARYNIMALLYVIERAEYLYVLNQTEMTSGNLTAHANKLAQAGYLSIQKKFVHRKPKTFLSLTLQGRKAFETYQNKMKSIFTLLPKSTDEESDSDKKE